MNPYELKRYKPDIPRPICSGCVNNLEKFTQRISEYIWKEHKEEFIQEILAESPVASSTPDDSQSNPRASALADS